MIKMIMTQAASLERPKVQRAMFAILGQDYKGGGNLLRDRWNRSNSGKGRSYFAGDDESAAEWGEEDTYYEEESDPKGRGRAALAAACVRCGSTSHKTAQCAQQATPKPSTTSSGKRQAVESMAILTDETSLVMLEDAAGHEPERPDCAMLDPGASSFLMGSKPLARYVNHIQQLSYDISQLQLHRCQRTFHFGSDHQKVSSWTVKVPVYYLNGQHGLIQGFVLSGETPMLVGRPVIKALDMTIDFSQQRIRFGNDDWQDAVLGRHEEYLLDLTSTFDSEQLSWEPSFDLQLDEQLGDRGSYDEFLTEEAIYQVEDNLMPQFTVPLTTKHWKTLVMQSQAQLNNLNASVDDTLREEHHAPPRVLWEVYTGRARLSQVAEAIGMTVKTFGYETGWNFALLSHQRAFLALQDEEMPDEVYLSPSCGPRSRMQNIAATSEQRQEILRNLRDWHHRTHLQFCKRVYLKQITAGRHSHIEQPTSALSWETTALQALPGYKARHRQCQYGAVCMDTDRQWKAAKKDTTIMTSKRIVAETMNKLCAGDHEHCRLEGYMKGFGTHRTAFDHGGLSTSFLLYIGYRSGQF